MQNQTFDQLNQQYSAALALVKSSRGSAALAGIEILERLNDAMVAIFQAGG